MLTGQGIVNLDDGLLEKLSGFFLNYSSLVREGVDVECEHYKYIESIQVNIAKLTATGYSILTEVTYQHKVTNFRHKFTYEIELTHDMVDHLTELISLVSVELSIVIDTYQDAVCDVVCEKCDKRHEGCTRGEILED